MGRLYTLVAWLVALLLFPGTLRAGPVVLPEDALRKHVAALADPRHEGRKTGSKGAEFASSYVAERFAEIGLEPAGSEGGWYQPFDLQGGGRGRNVMGLLPGLDEERLVIVGAHYDTLGTDLQGQIMHGADDNASGVAVLLEMARELQKGPMGRDVLFCALDASEAEPHFQGSRALAARLGERVAAYVNVDMLGSDLYPGYASPMFVLGTEHSPALAELLAPEEGIHLLRGGVYLIERTQPRSDYTAFRDAGVPFVYFTTGPTRHFHMPTDLPGTLRYDKMARYGGYVTSFVRTLSASRVAPDFVKSPPPDMDELPGILRLIDEFLARKEELGLSKDTVDAMEARRKKVLRMRERGKIDVRYLQKTLETLLYLTTGIEAGEG